MTSVAPTSADACVSDASDVVITQLQLTWLARVQLLDMAQKNLIQSAWEQLVRESGPQVSDGTPLHEVHVHRGHFNRSLLGGRFPPALEVRALEPRTRGSCC